MATIQPFKAWHPSPKRVGRVSCPPYDVITTSEARKLSQNKPESFLHIIRPEIDLPEATAFNDPAVYQKGAENLEKFMDEDILNEDDAQALYIYQLVWKDKKQTGIFGCVSVDDYDNDIILKHELTRPDKEDDRTRHIVDQQAHAEPVMLCCKDDTDIGEFAAKFCENHQAFFDFESPDHITHRLWKVTDPQKLVEAFAKLDHLYIADGHHRCKSASRAAGEEREKRAKPDKDAAFNYFPAVIFPMSEMNILAYNRLVYQVPDDFETRLRERFDVRENTNPTPARKGDVCFYFDGEWLTLKLPVADNATEVEQLDVHRLQQFILEPLLNIRDQRTDKNISFVGGIRGTDALQAKVDSGDAALGISMYPTGIEELVKVSDEGLLMPPKSTWFEPKLRSGLLVHTF